MLLQYSHIDPKPTQNRRSDGRLIACIAIDNIVGISCKGLFLTLEVDNITMCSILEVFLIPLLDKSAVQELEGEF